MDNKKTDQYYIKKIVIDLEFIIEHTNGLSQVQLEENEVLVDSVMFRLIQVAGYKTAITEALYKGTKRNVESEKDAKNA